MKGSDRKGLTVALVILCSLHSQGQRESGLPLTPDSFRLVLRFKTPVPQGRVLDVSDIKVHHYTTDVKSPRIYSTKLAARKLLADPEFDPRRPTVLYAHGYLELWSDESVRTVMSAYISAGGYNVLLLDFSNLAYGDYLSVCLRVHQISRAASSLVAGLAAGGVGARLHLVGHSLGAHVLAGAARILKQQGIRITRLSALDPAYPLFYPPLVLSRPLSAADADFVDVIHTDAGAYGAAAAAGHADYWPNGGHATQPGCPPGPLRWTTEDFCSHWRSWEYWSESVRGGTFLAVSCARAAFLRGGCHAAHAHMGLHANHTLRGNFYLRTAAESPYALGERGVN